MLKNQRHSQIIEILKTQGFVTVHELGCRLYASQPTVRRDLDFLEKQGYIRRSYGGAMIADDKAGTPVSFRRGTRTQEKMRICRLASILISQGDVVFIDASTTASYLAEHIKEADSLTVITNGYQICRTLAENNIKTFSTGGRLLRNSMAFVGKSAEECVDKYNADIMFFSSSALGDDGTVSDYSEEECVLRRCMYGRAKKRVLLCDRAKFGETSAFREFSLTELDYVVTDCPFDGEWLSRYGMVLERSDDKTYLYRISAKK